MRPRKKIILVDSDEKLLSERRFLLDNKGYNVFPCSSAVETLLLLDRHPIYTFDLIIARLNLPVMDGNELVGIIKKLHPYIKSLLVYDAINESVAECIADNFMSNASYSASYFLGFVRVMLTRKRGPKPKICKVT